MSERWARAVLTTYRWAGAAAYPLIGGYIAYRATRGKEDRHRRRERYGQTNVERPEGPLVWVHAASVGETIAVSGLVERLLSFGIAVVLTTGTVTSARVADERLGGRVIHQYVPLDLKPAITRFLNHWRPDLAIMAESEIWPTTIAELGARRVPQVLVNGRMSDRSFAGWRKRSHIAEAIFEKLAHVVAQSDTDGARFRQLGARPVVVAGNLKGDLAQPLADEKTLAAFKRAIGPRKSWAAVSTHEGEEAIAADIHRKLRNRQPGLLTIVVPRHPERADEIEEAFRAAGLTVARRSRGDRIGADTDILLGDTIGEMGLYLRLTEIAFVGRSLALGGGHNPIEPAKLGCAILSGSQVENFRDAYRLLIECGAARFVRDGDMLASGVNYLLNNEDARKNMVEAGLSAVEQMSGALNRTMAALEPYVHPLIVESRLQRGRGGR